MIRIGKVMGIDILLNFSWFFILLLITYSLAVGFFPVAAPGFSVVAYWIMGLVASVLLFASVLFHELSHSFIAKRNGLPVSSITLFIFGGVSNITEEPKTPGIEFRMAIAGPAMSFLLAGVFLVLWALGESVHAGRFITSIALYLWIINLILGIFNLVPGFPLDGGRVLRSILWAGERNLRKATRQASVVGQGFGYFLILGGLLMLFSKAIVGGLWFIFIGWFLAEAAQGSYQQLLVEQTLEGVTVGEIMTRDPVTIDGAMNVAHLVHDYFLKYHYGGFPVVENGRPVGIVSLGDVREVPRERWESVTVTSVSRPITADSTLRPRDDAAHALSKMVQLGQGRLAVIDDGRLVGMVTRTDVTRYLEVRSGLKQAA